MTEEFFTKHQLKQFSPQLFVYFKLMISGKDEITKMVTNAATGQLSRDRQKEVLDEASLIDSFDNADEIVRYMKRLKESQNREVLCEKALSMEKDTVPIIIEKFVKTANDSFAECAVMVLARCDKSFIELLFKKYNEIKYPYPQSLAAMVIGIRDIEDAAEILEKEVSRFEGEYPNETFEQGPLIGLYGLCKRPLK